MPGPAKYLQVKSVIKRRIQEGDYLVASIPGERRIAEQTGVSYMTARRAVQELLAEEVLVRNASGGLAVHPSFVDQAKPAELVLLYPAYPSGYLTQLRSVVTDAATRRGVSIRPGQFVHWDDNAVIDVVEQARGTLIIPHGPSIPPRVLDVLRANKVVLLDGDFANQGLPSIRLFTEGCIEHVIEHLWGLGHRAIDCLNTQNRNPEIDRRIDIWDRWVVRAGGSGVLHDDPAAEFTDPTAVAYQLMNRLLSEQRCEATAFVATTCPAAIGAMRACYEQGVRVGVDVSIAALNLEPPAEYFCPSITGLQTPDLNPSLQKCFDWFASDTSWQSSLLVEPEYSILFEGESTGPTAVTTQHRRALS